MLYDTDECCEQIMSSLLIYKCPEWHNSTTLHELTSRLAGQWLTQKSYKN